MVRLKGSRRCHAQERLEVFQFHNGSIKSLKGQSGSTRLSKFQFHNGSIKSS